MTTILDDITACKRREVTALTSCGYYDAMIHSAEKYSRTPISMSRSISESKTGIIAEFKRRSPSKGAIRPDASVSDIAAAYREAGAAACSILTDTQFFGGSVADLAVARAIVDIPLLRKEFIVSPCQIYESKLLGADAILLIAAILSPQQVKEFTRIAHDLGMEVILELHSRSELRYLSDEIDMIGINNRDLTSFHTDTAISRELIESLPDNKIKIAESGIASPEEMMRLHECGYRGFLIGEALMRHNSPGDALRRFTLNQ